MTYQDLLQKLFSKRLRVRDKSRQEMEVFVKSLGSPHTMYPSIHVTGTNGKGSVATKIAKTLEYSGYTVGLFTSPHVENFSERIQINGVEIPQEKIEKELPLLMQKFPDLCFFDYVTFLAFQYFRDKHVDVAVFEAGIGGLHDVTNLVHPLLSIITTVAFDHMELLGPTLEDIAFQKAGIIKPRTPAIVGPKARFNPIFEQAKVSESPLIEVPPQPGGYDHENQAIALAALEQLKAHFLIKNDALEKGLMVKPPCRFERFGRFVLDVAHNPEGFENLIKTWDYHHPGVKISAIVGLSSDKDLGSCLKLIANRAEHLFLVQTDSKRAASLEQLKEILQREGITHFTPCSMISNALDQALARDHDILVCGSFYIMKEIREKIFRLQIS